MTSAPTAKKYRGLKEKLDGVLTSITARERAILEMRFGLVDGNGHTLEEIGKIYNVTRERIRQIEAKALRKTAAPHPGSPPSRLPGDPTGNRLTD